MGGGSHQKGFVSCAGDLEEDLLLALEHDFAVINAPRHVHGAVKTKQLLGQESLVCLF
jgi:hypothetical protein